MSPANSPNNGGCDFVVDPQHSALIQPVFWTPEIDPATLPFIAGPSPAGSLRVSAETLHAHSIIELDETVLRLTLHGELYDVAIANAPDTRPLGAFVIFDEMTPDRLTAIERLWHAMFGKRVPPDPRITRQRRGRARQMLRAVDARELGATYRQIAEQLFPNIKHDAKTWIESPIRETTIRLARDGMAFVRGGYRNILRRPRRSR